MGSGSYGPVLGTPIGWVLPGLHDPDGHEMRFYIDDPERRTATSERPARMYVAGTSRARSEPGDQINLT
jgi:hypothetical protein